MSLLTLLAAWPGLAGPATTPTPVPPADPIRYRIEQRIESTVDLSAFGQGEQQQTQLMVWFVSVTYADTTGGRTLHAILDSVQADMGPAPLPPGALDSARGAVFHGVLDEWGKVVSLEKPAAGILAGLFDGMLRGFHPRVRPGATVGDTWTDTLTVDTETPMGTTNSTTVTNFLHDGVRASAGRQLARISAAFASSVTGTLETPAGAMEMDGVGTGKAEYHLGSDGILVSATSTAEGNASISGAFAPSAIPLRTVTTIAVTPLH